jgi:hypothetical protein
MLDVVGKVVELLLVAIRGRTSAPSAAATVTIDFEHPGADRRPEGDLGVGFDVQQLSCVVEVVP